VWFSLSLLNGAVDVACGMNRSHNRRDGKISRGCTKIKTKIQKAGNYPLNEKHSSGTLPRECRKKTGRPDATTNWRHSHEKVITKPDRREEEKEEKAGLVMRAAGCLIWRTGLQGAESEWKGGAGRAGLEAAGHQGTERRRAAILSSEGSARNDG